MYQITNGETPGIFDDLWRHLVVCSRVPQLTLCVCVCICVCVRARECVRACMRDHLISKKITSKKFEIRDDSLGMSCESVSSLNRGLIEA
jgi:hypothetical protein